MEIQRKKYIEISTHSSQNGYQQENKTNKFWLGWGGHDWAGILCCVNVI